ncbi:MAG: sulfotransferase [Actinomycetota bacterium]|nr:sulfotransferase [Actinomycetota bacterium]MDH5313955.1 sulfotransferase [Actinomycetota bacterium]
MSPTRRIPSRLTKPVRDYSVMAARIARAAFVRADRSTFDGVRCYCLFIGYPRSGHSLVGSIVGAHADAVISHELDALRYVQTGLVGRDLLYSMILRRDREFSDSGRTWTGYEYSVPGQAHGRFDELLVIGDKRGGGSTKRLRAHPELLDRLERLVEVDLRMVHVIRDPFDTITSMHRRGGTLQANVDRFFGLCATNAAIKARRPDAVIDVRLEALVEHPVEVVRRLVGFLGLEASHGYLDSCAAIVFEAPKRTRDTIEWPPRLITEVEHRLTEFEFLQGYAFDR